MIAELSGQILVEEIDEVEAAVRSRIGNRVRDFHLLRLGDGLVLLFHGDVSRQADLQHEVMQATDVRFWQMKSRSRF